MQIAPTWTGLRQIGNSRAVQASVVFPIVGYLILISNAVTGLFDGGLASGEADPQILVRLWSLKLYFVYFGSLSLGIGAALYQLRCPDLVIKHRDPADYYRFDGPFVTAEQLDKLAAVLDPKSELAFNDQTTRKIKIMNNNFEQMAVSRPVSRFFVFVLFALGFGLLIVPSIQSAAKVGAVAYSAITT